MKDCWDEGCLRAYLDRELPPEEMTRVAVHLGGCEQCHAQYNELAGRAARVAALMETLEARRTVSPHTAAARRWKKAPARPVAVAVLALAATVAMAFVLLPKRIQTPKPVAAPLTAPGRQAMQQAALPEPKVERPAPSPARAKGPGPKRATEPSAQYYLALDDEPIDTGVVMRMALDGAGVQADVIFDAEGRPRAIRTVK
jgi:anti-sigma factor RsiW